MVAEDFSMMGEDSPHDLIKSCSPGGLLLFEAAMQSGTTSSSQLTDGTVPHEGLLVAGQR